NTSWNTAGCTPPFWGLTAARVMGYLMRRMTITIHVNRALPDAHSRTHRDDPLEAPLDVAASFSAGALVGVVVDWLARGGPALPGADGCPGLAVDGARRQRLGPSAQAHRSDATRHEPRK